MNILAVLLVLKFTAIPSLNLPAAVISNPPVKNASPLALKVPFTSKSLPGLVFPIPTLPDESKVILLELFVVSFISNKPAFTLIEKSEL